MRMDVIAPLICGILGGPLRIGLAVQDAGGQKDLTDPRVQANVRQAIFNRKDQTLKNAFSEAARNKATVVNYLAQRILETAGKAQ